MKPYWRTCGHRHGNFGDELTRHILTRVIGVPIERAAEMGDADLISIGSILGEVPWAYRGWVWGTGAMHQHDVIDLPHAWICAVRGPLTARRIQQGRPVVFGDPGLLAGRLPIEASKGRYRLSIVPHYVDMDDEALARYVRRNPDVHVIDPCAPVDDVLREIASSAAVLSSSLHGLIVADAIGISNAWVRLSEKLAGGTFKFRDYYACFGINDPVPVPFAEGKPVEQLVSQCKAMPAAEVDKMGHALVKAFPRGWW
jgi:hypothetical protein